MSTTQQSDALTPAEVIHIVGRTGTKTFGVADICRGKELLPMFADQCEAYFKKECKVFARQRTIVWDNGVNPGKGKKSKINSKIYQIDYYKNNKKQIIFSTENEIHAYDRNGDYITEYPLKNPSKYKIDHFNIIDYDQSKQYRLALADIKGNI